MTRSITAEAGVDSTETVTPTGVQRIQGNVPVGGKALATGTVLVTSGSMYLSTAIKNGAYSAIVESGKTYLSASTTDRSAWCSVVARSDCRYTLDGLPRALTSSPPARIATAWAARRRARPTPSSPGGR